MRILVVSCSALAKSSHTSETEVRGSKIPAIGTAIPSRYLSSPCPHTGIISAHSSTASWVLVEDTTCHLHLSSHISPPSISTPNLRPPLHSSFSTLFFHLSSFPSSELFLACPLQPCSSTHPLAASLLDHASCEGLIGEKRLSVFLALVLRLKKRPRVPRWAWGWCSRISRLRYPEREERNCPTFHLLAQLSILKLLPLVRLWLLEFPNWSRSLCGENWRSQVSSLSSRLRVPGP